MEVKVITNYKTHRAVIEITYDDKRIDYDDFIHVVRIYANEIRDNFNTTLALQNLYEVLPSQVRKWGKNSNK